MSEPRLSQKLMIKPISDIGYSAWLKLWREYQNFYQSKISHEISFNTWNKLIAADLSHMYGFAAILDQHVVGIVHVVEHDSCWTMQPYAYLQDLYVNSE